MEKQHTFGIALDLSAGKMYWTDANTDMIQRVNLDGTMVEDLVTNGPASPSGIALDVAGDKMHWIDQGPGKIQRANLDGSNVETLIAGLNLPVAIALDLFAREMYSTTNAAAYLIQRTAMDGNSNMVDTLLSGLSSPLGIALAIPEPTALSLMTLGSLLVGRRRRRRR